jgi:sialic acid synthase SpsE
MPCELDTRAVARRSLVAARALPAGHRLAPADVAVKRPGTGIPPSELERVVGRTLARAVDADELLDWSALAR